ncbi:MAG: HAMP domain-containing histidine kinase [Paludibacteraceae bacterium]|nr:HAMP domain-containing histidine kinase [Paludibacteraceae bacterium]
MGNTRTYLTVIFVVLMLIVVASVLYTNDLARQLAKVEQQRVQIWAQATEKLILATPDEDIDFYTTIIERNTTIPVYMVDSDGEVLYTRNVRKPVADPTSLNGPIEIRFTDESGNEIVQFIYYGESQVITLLRYIPYVQFTLIFIFILLGVFALTSAQRNEQNRLWVGLSKETAHQLGTPISSLNGWQSLLEARYAEDELIPQMRTDIDRLQTIADRFSKVGSEPELELMPLIPVLKEAMSYMRTRTSNKVTINFSAGQLNQLPSRTIDENSILVMLNKPLFAWVIENLIKNAIDAMDGKGEINFVLYEKEHSVLLDVSDTGKGIDRRTQRRIFQPGFTTKKRGWGLGLSLSKRIVEDYHRGKLFLKDSQVGKGSTFRIVLEKSKDS